MHRYENKINDISVIDCVLSCSPGEEAIQVALCAIQYTFVSLAIPVRMEQHAYVISVPPTMTTPAHVLPTTQDRLATIS